MNLLSHVFSILRFSTDVQAKGFELDHLQRVLAEKDQQIVEANSTAEVAKVGFLCSDVYMTPPLSAPEPWYHTSIHLWRNV